MLRVEMTSAKRGMTLALPIVHPRYPKRVLLKVGYKLDDQSIGRAVDLGVKSIFVKYPALDFVEKFIDHEVIKAQGEVLEHITSAFEECQTKATAKLPYDNYCKSIGRMVQSLVGNPKAAVFMDDLGGDGMMRHATAVTYLSVLVGLKLEGYLIRQRKHVDPARAKEVTSLGLGAMLHDIGITQLNEEIVNHYYETGNEHEQHWQEHPSIGYEMVHGQIEPTAATCVLHHHQRYDGTGYCGSKANILQGDRIHIFARIVGLAEHFDRMRNPHDADPMPTVYVLSSLLHPTMIRKWDEQVLRALFSVVPPYPPGSIVRLSNKRYAVVIDHNAHHPCRPVVQPVKNPWSMEDADGPAGPPIDLSEHSRTLFIAECDGADVSELNFDPPDKLLEYQHRLSA